MEGSGLDPHTTSYDLYRGDDGYVYRAIPNPNHALTRYNTMVHEAANGASIPEIVEPPDACRMLTFQLSQCYA